MWSLSLAFPSLSGSVGAQPRPSWKRRQKSLHGRCPRGAMSKEGGRGARAQPRLGGLHPWKLVSITTACPQGGLNIRGSGWTQDDHILLQRRSPNPPPPPSPVLPGTGPGVGHHSLGASLYSIYLPLPFPAVCD